MAKPITEVYAMGVVRISLKRRHRFTLGRKPDTKRNPYVIYAGLRVCILVR
jgi:hypothetical protein